MQCPTSLHLVSNCAFPRSGTSSSSAAPSPAGRTMTNRRSSWTNSFPLQTREYHPHADLWGCTGCDSSPHSALDGVQTDAHLNQCRIYKKESHVSSVCIFSACLFDVCLAALDLSLQDKYVDVCLWCLSCNTLRGLCFKTSVWKKVVWATRPAESKHTEEKHLRLHPRKQPMLLHLAARTFQRQVCSVCTFCWRARVAEAFSNQLLKSHGHCASKVVGRHAELASLYEERTSRSLDVHSSRSNLSSPDWPSSVPAVSPSLFFRGPPSQQGAARRSSALAVQIFCPKHIDWPRIRMLQLDAYENIRMHRSNIWQALYMHSSAR